MSSIRDQLSSYDKKVGPRVGGRLAVTIDTSRLSHLGCGARCLKYFLMGFNVFIMVAGGALVAAGAYAQSSDVFALAGPGVINAVISMGALLVGLGSIGLIGSMNESRFFLSIFGTLLVLMMLVLLILGSICISYQGQEDSLVARTWLTISPEERCRIEFDYTCCGLVTFNDSYGWNGYACNNGANSNCPAQATTGCVYILGNQLRSYWTGFGAAGITMGIILLVGLATSCWLMTGITNANREVMKSRKRHR